MQQTWFIAGSSHGFGRALTQAALDAGDRVVATARNPHTLDDLVDGRLDDLLAVALAVTDRDAVGSALRAGIDRFGRIDIVVNNAGHANVAPIETGDDEDFRAQFETNFWGVYHVSKAAIEELRHKEEA
jgi:NAD(P)-dependent dehydrogenase (short-subunit alcohol dehydrogenase family)